MTERYLQRALSNHGRQQRNRSRAAERARHKHVGAPICQCPPPGPYATNPWPCPVHQSGGAQ